MINRIGKTWLIKSVALLILAGLLFMPGRNVIAFDSTHTATPTNPILFSNGDYGVFSGPHFVRFDQAGTMRYSINTGTSGERRASELPNGNFVLPTSQGFAIYNADGNLVINNTTAPPGSNQALSLNNGNVMVISQEIVSAPFGSSDRVGYVRYIIINSSGTILSQGTLFSVSYRTYNSLNIRLDAATFSDGRHILNGLTTLSETDWSYFGYRSYFIDQNGNVTHSETSFNFNIIGELHDGRVYATRKGHYLNEPVLLSSNGTYTTEGVTTYSSNINEVMLSLSGGSHILHKNNESTVWRIRASDNMSQLTSFYASGNPESYGKMTALELHNGRVVIFFRNSYGKAAKHEEIIYKTPSNVSLTTISNQQINASWSTNGNLAKTDYTLLYKARSSSTWLEWGTTKGTSFSVTGLQPGTQYDFRVRAGNYGSNYTTSTVSAWTQPATPAFTSTNHGGADEWHQTTGRGWVTLQWNAVQGATKYWLHVFDGQAYRKFDMGTATSWDSRTLKIYPAEARINEYGTNTRTDDIFVRPPQIGLDLRDNPRRLYETALSTQYNSNTNYWFRVSSENSGGEGPYSNAYQPTLPNRTDGTPPVVSSVIINDGDAKIYTRDLDLHVTATDALSGVTLIHVSNDSFATYQIIPFSNGTGTIEWQLTPGEGTKTVFVRAVDAAGNISPSLSASVAMESDRVSPQVTLTINNGSEATESDVVSLFINAYDNITPLSQLQMRVSNDGTAWLHYDTSANTWKPGWGPVVNHPGVWTLSGEDGMKYVYAQVKDADGNIGIAAKNIYLLGDSNRPEGNTTLTPTATAGTGQNLHGHVVLIDDIPMIVLRGKVSTIELTELQGATSTVFSHDGVSWSPPETIPSGATTYSKQLTFTSEGKGAVYFKLRNQHGAESEIFSYHYVVDYTPPTVSARTSTGATATKTGSIALIVTAQDNVSDRLFYSINGGAFVVLPVDGVVTATLDSNGLNNINVRVIDEAGNLTQTTVQVWKLS